MSIGIFVRQQWETTGIIILGTLTMIHQYANILTNSFHSITWQYSFLQQASTNLYGAKFIIDTYQKLKTSHEDLLHHRNKISVKIPQFSYDKNPILSEISLNFTPGETIALV
jgi:ABC-type multidrug transport system fused ATPase/permease subunit